MPHKNEPKGLAVTSRPGEHPDRMIKRFMKKVRNDGILQEVFLRRSFEKPSVKRRRKQSKARYNKEHEGSNRDNSGKERK